MNNSKHHIMKDLNKLFNLIRKWFKNLSKISKIVKISKQIILEIHKVIKQ